MEKVSAIATAPGRGVLTSISDNTAKNWWSDKGLRRCMLDIIIMFGSIYANGYDSGVMSSLQANGAWVKYVQLLVPEMYSH